jgi:tRNA pseudouridine13 synthase
VKKRITDRSKAMRRIFSGKFETSVSPESHMFSATVSSPRRGRNQHVARSNWRDRGSGDAAKPKKQNGEYLHFTLYKENKDTMEAINYIARLLKIKASNFGFAGTKDRRAATCQRMSVHWYQDINSLNWLNTRETRIRVGDFSFHKNPIQLGQHGGNEFIIVLKNTELTRGAPCSVQSRLENTQVCVQAALDHVMNHGYINYYGLQRFGTHTFGTQEIGMMILKGDFKKAVDAILHVDAEHLTKVDSEAEQENKHNRDILLRAQAIKMWRSTGEASTALKLLPKRFTAEHAIIQYLGRGDSTARDFCGALMQITRGLRNLYIHGYQSLVWNWAASTRWSKYGTKVVAGDVVLEEAEGDPSRLGAAADMSLDATGDEDAFYQRGRVLTKEDVASGKYSIFDVVLPVPGYDCYYPDNAIGDFYVEFMGRPENGCLDPYSMRRPQREFSLSGSYRKLMARFSTTPKFQVRAYKDDQDQMHPTDLDEILLRKAAEKAEMQEMRAMAAAAAPGRQSFAANVDSHDTAASDGLRQQRAQDRPDDPPEARIDEKWIETSKDGTSKRQKIISHSDALRVNNDGDKADRQRIQLMSALEPCDNTLIPSNPATAALSNAKDEVEGAADMAQGHLTSLGVALAHFPKSEPIPDVPLSNSSHVVASDRISPGGHNRVSNSEIGLDRTAGKEGAHDGKVSMQNAFRAAEGRERSQSAIDLTDASDFKDATDEMKVAVVLNFRLSSSNYATICLRELMGLGVVHLTSIVDGSAAAQPTPAQHASLQEFSNPHTTPADIQRTGHHEPNNHRPGPPGS